MPVKWKRLGDIAPKTTDAYLCARCLEPTAFEDCWTVMPLTVEGRQMLQGYIHCGTCRKTPPTKAWQEAHDKDPH
jgi:hypothetical protein